MLSSTLEIKEIEKDFKGRMKTYDIKNTPDIKDPKQFLETARPLVINKVKEQVQEKNLKINLVLLAEYKKPVMNEDITHEKNLKTKNIVIHPTDSIEEYVKKKEKKILTEMEEFEIKASGWTLKKQSVYN